MSATEQVNKICHDDLEVSLGNMLLILEDQVLTLQECDPLNKSIPALLQKMMEGRIKLEQVRESKRNRYEEIRKGKMDVFEACIAEFFKRVPAELMDKVRDPLIDRVDLLLRDDENESKFTFEKLEEIYKSKAKISDDL